jgi:hypothetical protein
MNEFGRFLQFRASSVGIFKVPRTGPSALIFLLVDFPKVIFGSALADFATGAPSLFLT